MNASTAMRSDRIDVRTNPEVKLVIERAAQLSHKSISAYILESALQKAQDDIHKTERLLLTKNERDLFFSALINPPEPNEALKSLFANSSKVGME